MHIGKSAVNIEFLGHSGFLIENGIRIAIDPYNVSERFGKVDVILVSHGHYDHCSIKDIEKLVNKERGTVVVCTADVQSKIMKLEGVQVEIMEVGDKIKSDGIVIEAVPAYNKYTDHHPKSEGWVGYVVKMDNIVIYHAGDTDFIPEMQKLSGHGKHDNEFIALLPVSGKTVMNAQQASEAASLINPDLAIPMNYGADLGGNMEDAQRFVDLCKEINIKAELLEKI